jgi:hypothetical protein
MLANFQPKPEATPIPVWDDKCPHCSCTTAINIGSSTNPDFMCQKCRAIFYSKTSAEVDKRGEFSGQYGPVPKENLYTQSK